MAVRIRLLKSYKAKNMKRTWPVGQVIQVLPSVASELLADKIGALYDGKYPPKEKMKIKL